MNVDNNKERKIKKLVKGILKTGGRNNNGRITSFHKGGGHKQLYRVLDVKKEMQGVPAKVKKIEYDPQRSGKIALAVYSNGYMSYTIAVNNLKKNDIIITSDERINWDNIKYNIKKEGSTYKLKECHVGDMVSNIEIKAGSGGKLIRSAGVYGIIRKKNIESNYVIIKMPSGEERIFSGECKAIKGRISNENKMYEKLRKAGENRWRGKRPVVRGVAMNPVDHPHGGRTKGGRPDVTPWGKLTKGKKTRSKRKKNKLIIKRN